VTGGGGGGEAAADLDIWQYWWGFNKEPYINLKAHVHAGAVVTGSDDFFLGHGEKSQSRDSLRPSEEAVRGKVVPALIQALQTERSNDIVTGCMVALAKIGDAKTESGDSQMAAEIKKFLADPNQEIAETAAVALGILANEAKSNLDILTLLLENNSAKLRTDHKINVNGEVNYRSRAFAAFGLGLIGAKAKDENKKLIVDTLVKMLDGESRTMSTRDVAVACLTSLGLTPLPIDAAQMTTPIDVKRFGKVAEVKTRQDQILWLMNYFEDVQGLNRLVRAHVPRAVALLLSDCPADYWLRNAVAQRFLNDISKSSTEKREVQQSCIIALGQIGDCDDQPVDIQIREGLMKVEEELKGDLMARNFAMIALAQACGRPGAGGADPIAGLNAKKEKDSPRAYLLNTLTKGKTSASKSWAALALGVMERALSDAKFQTNADVRFALRNSLKEAKSPMEVGAFAVSVGLIKDPEAKDVLKEKLGTITDAEARGYVAVGVGLVDDRTSIEQITEIIRKSKYQPDLLKSAAIGLGLLGDKQIVTELVTMLGDASALSSQAAISSALGFIGDARSIDPLITMLQDKQKTDRARGFAAVALGIVSDKEDLPWNTKISVNINYRANTTTLTAADTGTGILDIL
jgi:HEAT repeat protein